MTYFKILLSTFLLITLCCTLPIYAMDDDETREARKVQPLPPYDWSKVLKVPPGATIHHGSQVLHFKSLNKKMDETARNFVVRHLSKAKEFTSDAEVLRFGSDSVNLQDGWYLEMGVCTGKTINGIAFLNPHKII